MAESGCLRDMAVQNLEVAGSSSFLNSLGFKEKVTLLTDANAAAAIRTGNHQNTPQRNGFRRVLCHAATD